MTTLPAMITFTGTVNIEDPFYNQQAYLDGYNFRIAWMTRSSIASGGVINKGSGPHTAIYDKGVRPEVGLVLYDNAGWSSGSSTFTASDASIDYSFAGLLYYPDRPVTGTANVTGYIIPGYQFDHWDAWCSDMFVSVPDSTNVDYIPIDGQAEGQLYDPIGAPPNEGEVTINVLSKGDYVYISSYEVHYDVNTGEFSYPSYQVGKEVKVPYKYFDIDGWFKPIVHLIYDDTHGTFSGETDTVYVTVSGGGKSKMVPVVLTKEYTCAQVVLDPPTLAPGDTATLILTTEYGGDFEPDQKFDVWIEEEGDSVGTLLAGTQTGKLLTQVGSPVKYIAPSSVDSSKKFHVGAFAYGFVGGGGEARAPVDIAPVLTKVSRPAALQAAKQPARRKTIAELNRRLAVEGCTMPGEVEVVAPRTILLGEEIYYYVVESSGGLEIHETSKPERGSGGLEQATFDDPDAAEGSEKNPVYWQDQYPIDGKGNTKTLPGGMIRLIGRYWEKDKTFKTILTAHLGSQSKSIQIEVIEPDRLFDSKVFSKPYATTWNIRGAPLNIDSLCIWYGGRIGIPPQVIKGQMFQEADKTGDRFNPSYRYEPWADHGFAAPTNPFWEAYMEQPFWVTGKQPNPMGQGKAIPNDHQNVQPDYYPTAASSIADFTIANWPKYFLLASDSIIANQALTRKFKEYLAEFRFLHEGPILGGEYTIATMLIHGDIRRKYTGYAQTRKAASYGLIQMLYTTAKNPLGYNRGKSINTSSAPEELNDEIIEMPFYKSFTEENLRRQFGGKNAIVPAGDWPRGWEKTWMESFIRYNEDPRYGVNVFNHSRKFYPQRKQGA